MGRRSRTAEGPSDRELFEIELESLEREFDEDFDVPAYATAFACSGPEGMATAYVTVIAEDVTTVQIVPQAMSELHKLFAALAEQTRGWLIEEPK